MKLSTSRIRVITDAWLAVSVAFKGQGANYPPVLATRPSEWARARDDEALVAEGAPVCTCDHDKFEYPEQARASGTPVHRHGLSTDAGGALPLSDFSGNKRLQPLV